MKRRIKMGRELQFSRLVIAAYRLPFRFINYKSGYRAVQSTGGLVSAMLALSESFRNTEGSLSDNKIVWAGVTDSLPEDFNSGKIENEYFNIKPVFLPHKLNELYYGGFCNDLLWPLFHYFPSYSVFNKEYFSAYEEANHRFCEQMIKNILPGDFIWIHDYQLMMLPDMIRKHHPDATIGFFLHIPFPSFELFRLLPRHWRESLVGGMLGADLIGFHTNDYAQNFIKSVKRTLGYECKQNLIYTPHKVVKADVFPIGIDYDKFHSASLNKNVVGEKRKIKALLSDQKLIFSVDRLDYSKGLLHRLKGFETFLERYPQWRTKTVFNMVVVPSRDNIEKYREMKKEIESTVGRINGRFSTLSWRPIVYQYRSLSFNELVALYDISDVGLITPLRDGMNLVAKEYIASQNENRGVLILSEMAGAAAELTEALVINPADDIEVADSIFLALEMNRKEKNARIERMQKRISSYNVFTWARDFFDQTYDTIEGQRQMRVRILTRDISSLILQEFRLSSRRMLFLDYDGTLVSFARYPEQAVIDKHTLGIIQKLAEDDSTEVVIISGRTKDFLERQFGATRVTLVAEHGYFIREPYGSWLSSDNSETSWKRAVMPILTEYVSRCNGTFIEEKSGCLAWHYRNADVDFAQLRLNELRDDLSEMIRHKADLEILEGHKVLEIKSNKYNKAMVAMNLIEKGNYDFLLAAGDDKADEMLFRRLPMTAHTIRVGFMPSVARYSVPDIPHLVHFLKRLTE